MGLFRLASDKKHCEDVNNGAEKRRHLILRNGERCAVELVTARHVHRYSRTIIMPSKAMTVKRTAIYLGGSMVDISASK